MFDSHAHISFQQYDADRADVIARARTAGITGWIEIGTDMGQSKKAVALAESEGGVFASVGIHPNDINSITNSTWAEVREMLSHPKVKAIGEVGLDFYRGSFAERQRDVVHSFLHLAKEYDLPVILHVRSGPQADAHEEMLYILSTFASSQRPTGVIHTYSGNMEQARKYLEYGMYLSFSGVVTFENAGPVLEAAAWAPLDRILIETDAPFLTPAPFRGKRNEPAYVKYVAEKIAQIRGTTTERIMLQTERNATSLFRLTAR